MIPETLGHRVKIGPNKVVPIIAWDEDCEPLIAGKHRLEKARYATNPVGRYEIVPPSKGGAR